jgi:vacuolar-type H+-ATPase subunit I/STV1
LPVGKKREKQMHKVIEFLKSNYKTILKVGFALFILYYLIFFLAPKVEMSAQEKQKIDTLNTLIQKLHEDNVKLEQEIDEYNNKIDEVDLHIDKIKGQKTIVKEIYHEKINNVDKLTVREIDSFFTDRYNK